MGLQRAGHPRDPSSGALRGDDGADPALRLFPDLLPRGFLRRGVVRVLELPGEEVCLGVGRHDLTHPLQGEVDVRAGAGGQHELGAVGTDHLLPLVAHALRHHDEAGIAFDRGYRGTCDAGVPGRALDDRHARLQVAARFGTLDHSRVDPVLDRSRRPIPLDLRQNLDVERGDAP